MSVLEIEGLTKQFGTVSVLRNVSLTVAKGEIVSLLGVSGSGKTTLARIVCGLLEANSGSVRVAGKEVSGIDVNRPLSFMPQESGFWATLSLRSQLALALRSTRARYSRTEGIIKLAKLGALDDRLSAFPSELSTGELRRLAFLRAMAVECDLLILDEPFTSIDEATETRMQQIFRQYIEEVGCGVLLITHDFEHALLLADRAAVLHGGIIVQDDDPATLLRSPQHGAVVRVLGEINVWPASIPTKGSGIVDTTVGRFPLPRSFKERTAEQIVYTVPTESLSLGEGEPGIRGIVESAIPGSRSLHVVLRRATDSKRLEVGLPLRSDVLEHVRTNLPIAIKWPVDEGRVLNDR